ncbi:unnamed protein product [Brassica oleracea]
MPRPKPTKNYKIDEVRVVVVVTVVGLSTARTKLSSDSNPLSQFFARTLSLLRSEIGLHRRKSRYQRFDEYEYERTSWDNEWSVTPNCWLKTLETFEFSGCKGRPQERELS